MAATRQDAAIIILPDRGPGIYTPPPRSSPDSNDGEPGLDRKRQRRASARAKQQRKPGCAGALQGTLVHPRARPQYAAHAHPVSAAHARYERVGERKVRGILGVERPVGRPEVPRGVAQLGRRGETGEIGDPVGQGPMCQRSLERLAGPGQPFETTLAHWALANWVSDLPGFTASPELRYTTWHFRTTYGSLHSQNPTNFPLAYPLVPSVSGGDGGSVSGVLRSGSGGYQRALQGAGAPGFALLFSASGGAPLPLAIEPRLTIIRIR